MPQASNFAQSVLETRVPYLRAVHSFAQNCELLLGSARMTSSREHVNQGMAKTVFVRDFVRAGSRNKIRTWTSKTSAQTVEPTKTQ